MSGAERVGLVRGDFWICDRVLKIWHMMSFAVLEERSAALSLSYGSAGVGLN